MMQRANVVEKFTAHYVFALGLSRFVSCAHWVLQVLDGDTFVFKAMYMGLWPACVLLSEIVQTFVLADFWYVGVMWRQRNLSTYTHFTTHDTQLLLHQELCRGHRGHSSSGGHCLRWWVCTLCKKFTKS